MDSTETLFDVAIIGAGPTGLTAANLLGQAGVSTLLVERNARTVSEPRAVVIDDEAMRTFQAAGLDRAISPHLRTGRATRYFSRVGAVDCFAEVYPRGDEYGFPKRMRFHQPDLERILREGLSRFSNVSTRFESALTGFEQSPDQVCIHLAGETGPKRVRARYLLACDGGGSSIRAALGVEMAGDTFAEPWLALDLVNDPFDPDDTLIVCDPLRPTVSVPGPNKRRRFEFLIKHGEDKDRFLAEGAAESLLAPYGYDQRTPPHIERRAIYTFHARVAQKWRHGRVLLAGDAAHMMPPFMGQGMNSCIRDAHNVCWKLAAVVNGELGEDALDTYEAERRPHVGAMINISATVARLAMTTNRAKALARDLAFKAARFAPPLRRYLNQQMFKPRPEYRDGLFLGDEDGVGQLSPQPLLMRQGEQARLDDLIGPGFAILAIDCGTALPAHPLWDALAPTRIDIGDGETRWAPVGASPITTLISRHHGKLLLVRPDRYVCGVFDAGDAQDFISRFAARFGVERRAVAA